MPRSGASHPTIDLEFFHDEKSEDIRGARHSCIVQNGASAICLAGPNPLRISPALEGILEPHSKQGSHKGLVSRGQPHLDLRRLTVAA